MPFCEKCSICHTDMIVPGWSIRPSTLNATLPCSHMYHYRCIKAWEALSEVNAPACPLCRYVSGFKTQIVRGRMTLVEFEPRGNDDFEDALSSDDDMLVYCLSCGVTYDGNAQCCWNMDHIRVPHQF